MDLKDMAEEWSLYLGELAPSSRVVYLRAVAQFADYMDRAHPDVTEPTQRHVRLWLQTLSDGGRSDATRRVRLIALRAFFAFLVDDPTIGIESNPAAGIVLPKVTVQPVPIVGDDDLAKLLRSIEGAPIVQKRDPFRHNRDASIIRTLLIGCRRGELCGLDVTDVDLTERTLALRQTKGGRARTIDMGGDKLPRVLRRYLRARAQHGGSDHPALFISDRESPVSGWRLTGEGVAAMLSRRCAEAGVPMIRPHRFRHTAAHDLLANGALEGEVERIFGWSGGAMVRRYGASVADERARNKSRALKRGDRV